jgi:hypothetical protein
LTTSSLVASIVVKLGFGFSVSLSTSAHASSEGRSNHPPRTLRSSYTDTVPEMEIIAQIVCMWWRLLSASSLVASIVVKLGFGFSVCSSTRAHDSSGGAV